MSNHLTTVFLFIFLSPPLSLFSQQETNITPFDQELKNKSAKFNNEANFRKSRTFFFERNWDSTLVYSMKQLNDSENNTELIDYCHFLRGLSFQHKKLFKEAEKELSTVSSVFEFYPHTYMVLDVIALEQRRFQKAIDYFKKTEAYTSEQLSGIKKSNIDHNLGVCYLHLEQYDQAETYLLESETLYEEQKDTLALIRAYGNIANLYYNQYKDDQAIPYFTKAYELSKKTDKPGLKVNTALNMAVVEENRKNFPLALTYRKEYEKWNDSLNDQNKVWEVAQIEKEFAVKEKQKEVHLANTEKKIKETQRNGLFYSAIVLLLLLGTTIYFYREKVKTNKIIVDQKESLDELNATKNKLFSIVSHDLRSSVQALKRSNKTLSENLEAKNLETLDTLLHTNSSIVNGAYNLLDNLLNWALLQTEQSYFEITSLPLFLTVEHVAHNYKTLLLEKNIHFENTLSKSDKAYGDQESIKIVLRNLIDNAIKFGKTDGFIKVYIENTQDTYCNLIIEDNGIGMSESTRQNLLKKEIITVEKENKDIIGSGLGWQLCKSMIEKNNGKFSIESELGKGTKMIISLPKTI